MLLLMLLSAHHVTTMKLEFCRVDDVQVQVKLVYFMTWVTIRLMTVAPLRLAIWLVMSLRQKDPFSKISFCRVVPLLNSLRYSHGQETCRERWVCDTTKITLSESNQRPEGYMGLVQTTRSLDVLSSQNYLYASFLHHGNLDLVKWRCSSHRYSPLKLARKTRRIQWRICFISG